VAYDALVIAGVVPAAGRAVRLQPLQGSKELLRVRGRPVMDHLVERLRAARPDEVRVVTRADKQDVLDHARSLGLACVVGEPRTVAESLALGLEGLAPADIVLFGFPDTLWEPEDGFARLRAAVEAGADTALGVFQGREPERSDVVELDESRTLVAAIHVKPTRPPTRLVWGCLAARVGALAGVGSELEPGHLLDRHARAGRVAAVEFGTDFVDIGTPEALAAVEGAPA
jgi:NDP-sugar pyrophosphorylase family protein